MEKGVGSRHGESGDETELRSGLVLARGSSKDDDKDHVPNQAILEPCPLPLRETGVDTLNQKPKTLHENGMVKGFVRKLGEKEAILDEIALANQKPNLGQQKKCRGRQQRLTRVRHLLTMF